MSDRRGRIAHFTDWVVVIGYGLFTGYVVGVGMLASYTHAMWPVLAGLGVAVACAVVVRGRPVLAAAVCSSGAVMTAVAIVRNAQLGRGFWPVTDDFIIEHYGTDTQATLRIAVLLLALVVVPCVVAALAIAFVRRRALQRATAS